MQAKVLRERQRKIMEMAQASGITTLWISMPPNRFYFSNYAAEDGALGESSGWLFLRGDKAFLLTDNRYTYQAEEEALGVKVKGASNLLEALDMVIKTLGPGVVGYEEEYITCGQSRRFLEKARERGIDVGLRPVDTLISSMRETKDGDEIERIKKGGEILSGLMAEVQGLLREGISEIELSRRIYNLALEMGAEGLAFPTIVASGPNSALPHASPTNRVIKSGEPIIVDLGIRYMNYMTDMTRTFFIGEPEPQFKEVYLCVLKAQRSAIEGVRAGLEAREADSLARDLIFRAGYGDAFLHGLGHGVGLAVHEGPRLGPSSKDILKENNVFTVEPGIYLKGRGGVRIEDMVLLTPDGAIQITRDVCKYEF